MLRLYIVNQLSHRVDHIEIMAGLKVAKSRGGIARASLTRLEKNIFKFEDKHEISTVDRQTVQSLIEKVQPLDDTFKEYCYVIADEAEETRWKTSKEC